MKTLEASPEFAIISIPGLLMLLSGCSDDIGEAAESHREERDSASIEARERQHAERLKRIPA